MRPRHAVRLPLMAEGNTIGLNEVQLGSEPVGLGNLRTQVPPNQVPWPCKDCSALKSQDVALVHEVCTRMS